MDGDTRGLVDHYKIIVLMDHADGFGRHGGLVSMQSMRYSIAILQLRRRGGDSLTVDEHAAVFNGGFLGRQVRSGVSMSF